MLRQLLPAQALVASTPPAETRRFGPDHRERLRQLIERTVLAGEVDEAERLRVREREEAAALAAALPVEATKAVAPPPESSPTNVVPIDATARANANLPPAHYLREGQPREAWRDHCDGRVTGPPPWPLPR
jgi:hypothetical protein